MRLFTRPFPFSETRIVALSITLAVAVLSGCAAGPGASGSDLREPARAAWRGALPTMGAEPSLETWWASFDDDTLIWLLAAAQQSSPTLEAALARVRQARAEASMTRAARLPSLTLQGQPYTHSATQRGYSLSLAGSAGVDLAGLQTHAEEAAAARAASAAHTLQSAQAALAADVADAYFARRKCLRELELVQDDRDSKEKTLELTAKKLDAGVLAPADMARARASVLSTEGLLQGRRAACDRTLNHLTFLTGLDTPELSARITAWPVGAAPYRATVTTVPADLLTRRPDLLAARARVVAASADVGAATAARLPQLSLSGVVTAASIGANGPADPATTAWNLAAGLVAPLFDGGRRANAVNAAEQRFAESVAAYRGAVRLAVREVEDALTRVAAADAQLGYATRAEEAYARHLDAVDARYLHGAVGLLELEEARQLFRAAQLNTVSLRTENRQAYIALYRALGGGWSPQEI